MKLRTGWGVCRDVGGGAASISTMPFWAAAAWSRTARYQQHFARPILHEQDLQHEELLAGYPERWGNLVRDICLSE